MNTIEVIQDIRNNPYKYWMFNFGKIKHLDARYTSHQKVDIFEFTISEVHDIYVVVFTKNAAEFDCSRIIFTEFDICYSCGNLSNIQKSYSTEIIEVL